jgi:hypothetical protein
MQRTSGKVDLERIAELLNVSYQQYNGYIASQCIFHDDSRPSLMIYPDKYNCLSCGAWGYTENLLKKLEGNSSLTRPKVKQSFSNPFSRWTYENTLGQALKRAWLNNKKNPSIYMKVDRKIPPEIQIKYGIGILEGWITFPIRSKDGKIDGAVARALPEMNEKSKYTVPTGQNPNLLYVPDWSLLENSKKIFITFGIIDAVTLAMYGFPAASTTNGKRIDPYSLKMRILHLFVPDKGEESDANMIAACLDWRGKVIKINYPDDCKDINEVHVKHPKLLQETRQQWLKN